jgi:quercetin dioxygenase-like cupin family protein
VEFYEAVIRADDDPAVDTHADGRTEHVLVIDGRLRVGPVDDPVELGPGDYVSFPGELPHIYQAIGGDARLSILVVSRPGRRSSS